MRHTITAFRSGCLEQLEVYHTALAYMTWKLIVRYLINIIYKTLFDITIGIYNSQLTTTFGHFCIEHISKRPSIIVATICKYN